MSSKSSSPPFIRVGLLFIPSFDVEASHLLRAQLRLDLPNSAVVMEETVGDQHHWIEEVLRSWCDEEEIDLLLTVGGCSPSPGASGRESVPAATRSVGERPINGVAEAMRAHASHETELAFLHCGETIIRGRTLIINLPAEPAPALLFWEGAQQLIGPICAYLNDVHHAPQMSDMLELEQSSTSQKNRNGKPQRLDANEFAAFLQRDCTTTSDECTNNPID